MRVRTIRTHGNDYGKSFWKEGSAGAVYEVDEAEAKRLIRLGVVEPADKTKTGAKK